MDYRVKIEKFEGPLDLLLELIEKEKLEITEISLSKVADHFLAFIESNDQIKTSLLADFLLVAAQLLYIKSKVLIPEVVTDENEDNIGAEELAFRLKEYKKFKEAAKKIRQIFFGDTYLFERRYFVPKLDLFYPGENLKLENLEKSFLNLIRFFEKQEKFEEKSLEQTVSISEKIDQIKKFLTRNNKLDFNLVTANSTSKVDLIVSFLALLELIKRRSIDVKQESLFGNILVESIKN